jgi:hypothetical protein
MITLSAQANLIQDYNLSDQSYNVTETVKAIRANVSNNPNYNTCYVEDFVKNKQYTLKKDSLALTYIQILLRSNEEAKIEVGEGAEPYIKLLVLNHSNNNYHRLTAYTDHEYKNVKSYKVEQLKGTDTYNNNGTLLKTQLEPSLNFTLLQIQECDVN